ncbi:MAG: hypothetical protein NTV65_11455 [Proteobacteria bacterium]|nr:hypothetical protein [Pseudomonadota bacterium]
MLHHENTNPVQNSNAASSSLLDTCLKLPNTPSLRFLAADPQHQDNLSVIASLPSTKLQAAALDFLQGVGGPGCIPIIGQHGEAAKALAPLLARQLDALAEQPHTSEERARIGMLNAALAAVDPVAFAERLKNSPKDEVRAAVGAVIVYSLEGRADTETMRRLAQSNVSEVRASAENWINLSRSSFAGELAHISLGEGFANTKVAFQAFLYRIASSSFVQKAFVEPLLSASFAAAPIVLDDPTAADISKFGLEVLHSAPGTVQPKRHRNVA